MYSTISLSTFKDLRVDDIALKDKHKEEEKGRYEEENDNSKMVKRICLINSFFYLGTAILLILIYLLILFLGYNSTLNVYIDIFFIVNIVTGFISLVSYRLIKNNNSIFILRCSIRFHLFIFCYMLFFCAPTYGSITWDSNTLKISYLTLFIVGIIYTSTSLICSKDVFLYIEKSPSSDKILTLDVKTESDDVVQLLIEYNYYS